MVLEETVVTSVPFDEAVDRTKEALAAEGFGVLTEIDVQSTLRTKIGKEIDRYVIIGACNPTLAGRAIDAEPSLGVLLPCNVVVREAAGEVVIEAMDPGVMANLVGTEAIGPVADEARRRIGSALERLVPTR
jgi:uncharacterized protein (DUF302 family)